MIDNRIIEEHFDKLGPACYAVYSAILVRMDRERKTFPSYKWLTKTLAISRATVARAIRTLLTLELIVCERRPGKSSVYHVTNLIDHEIRESEDGSYVKLRGTVQNSIASNPCHQGTTSGSLVTPPRFRGDTPQRGHHVGVYQHPTSTTPVVAVGRVEDPPEIDPRIAQLVAHGVALAVARRLAPLLPAPLLTCIVDYFAAGAGGHKQPKPGLLVRFCENPTAWGFSQLPDGTWKAPAIGSKQVKSTPPAAAVEDVESRRRRIATERRRAAEEARRAKEEPALYLAGKAPAGALFSS